MAKRRDANFTREETDKLMELVDQYLDVILNNRCTSEVNRQKDDAWNLIAEEFNSYTTNHRTSKQLKHKLENMKKRSELRELLSAKSLNNTGSGAPGDDDNEHVKWLKRINQHKENSKKGHKDVEDWEELDDNWEERDIEEAREEPSEKKLKIQTIYVKPLPTLNCSDNSFAREVKTSSDSCHDDGLCASREVSALGVRKFYSQAQIAELFKLECKHKQEKQKQQLEQEKKLQEAQLNKLALEARIYEAQLNKTNLEVKQLTRRLQREEELHSARMKREAEMHALQVERCKVDTKPGLPIKENASDD